MSASEAWGVRAEVHLDLVHVSDVDPLGRGERVVTQIHVGVPAVVVNALSGEEHLVAHLAAGVSVAVVICICEA